MRDWHLPRKMSIKNFFGEKKNLTKQNWSTKDKSKKEFGLEKVSVKKTI